MIEELVKLANQLDARGLREEADYLDNIIYKLSADEPAPLALNTLDDFDPEAMSFGADTDELGSAAHRPQPHTARSRRYGIFQDRTEAPTVAGEEVERELQKIFDPDGDKKLTLAELVDGLEEVLGVSLGDVDEDGWLNVDWEALGYLVRSRQAGSVHPDAETYGYKGHKKEDYVILE